MLSTYSKAAKLRLWLARPDCPDFIRECKNIFNAAFPNRKPNETDNDDMAESAYGPVPTELRPLISECQVALRARHRFNSVVFARSSTHVGNSLVMFHPEGNTSISPTPASIKYIVVLPEVNGLQRTLYTVYRQLETTPGSIDPFAPYAPYFPAKVYSTNLSPNLELISPDWVLSHYARWQLDRDRAVVLTLSRVSVHLLWNYSSLTLYSQD